MNILQENFNDHFNTVIESDINIRPAVIENVTKIDMKYGYTLYACQHCGKFKVVPFRCSCGHSMSFIFQN